MHQEYDYYQPPTKKNSNAVIIAVIVFMTFLVILLTALFLVLYEPNKTADETTDPAVVTEAPAVTETGKPQVQPTVAPTPPPNTAVVGYRYVVNVPESVYLRKSPSDNSGHYYTIPLGTRVGFIENTNSKYTKVSHNGTIGYITSIYLGKNPPGTSSSSNTVSGYKYVVNVPESVYLRKSPSDSSGYYYTIPLGTRVGFIANANGYTKVSHNGTIGYITSIYLGDNPPSSSSSSASSAQYMTVTNVPYSIYLRSQPKEDPNNIICEIPVGSKVQYLGVANQDFLKISWNGKVGYAKGEYLR